MELGVTREFWAKLEIKIQMKRLKNPNFCDSGLDGVVARGYVQNICIPFWIACWSQPYRLYRVLTLLTTFSPPKVAGHNSNDPPNM
jgi:hypothetical protein